MSALRNFKTTLQPREPIVFKTLIYISSMMTANIAVDDYVFSLYFCIINVWLGRIICFLFQPFQSDLFEHSLTFELF